jgi:hypothetical protein
MRIGRINIDTDAMTVKELNDIINELTKIRGRKIKAGHFMDAMHDLLEEARTAGFTFVDKDFGQVLQQNDFVIYDEQKGE